MPRVSAILSGILLFGSAVTSPKPAYSQGAGPAPQMSLTQQAAEASRRVEEYRELFKSSDLRSSALQMAMKETNPVIRGMALTEGLRPFKTLTPEFVLPPSGVVSAGDVPSLVVSGIRWADDGKSFEGSYTSQGCSGFSVSGQVSGGKVTISYPFLCFKLDWSIVKVPNTDRTQAACQVIMAPNADGDYLEGPMRCTNVSKVLNVRLPFGS